MSPVRTVSGRFIYQYRRCSGYGAMTNKKLFILLLNLSSVNRFLYIAFCIKKHAIPVVNNRIIKNVQGQLMIYTRNVYTLAFLHAKERRIDIIYYFFYFYM